MAQERILIVEDETAMDDPEAARRFLGRILQQCSRLQTLLEDLLTLSRLENL